MAPFSWAAVETAARAFHEAGHGMELGVQDFLQEGAGTTPEGPGSRAPSMAGGAEARAGAKGHVPPCGGLASTSRELGGGAELGRTWDWCFGTFLWGASVGYPEYVLPERSYP